MKAYIGPYREWVGPFQIAEKLMFWEKRGKYGEKSDKVHDFGTWLANDKNGDDSVLMKLCNWIQKHKKRKVKIVTHPYDHWNAHNTISMIALPILKDLKAHKNSYGFVKDEDVPEHLKSTNAEIKGDEYNGSFDSNAEARFNWVLDEILWALEQDQPDNDWEEQYTSEHAELDMTEYPEDKGKTAVPVRWKKEGKYDWEGMKKHQARIDNGFRLFGLYYQCMWD